MATTQEWLRVNVPPPERSGSSDACPESGTVPKAIFGQQQSSLRQHPRRRRRRDAPGPIACSRSSDAILQRSTNVALSPVTGPGATSFSSVASAFDFHHHLGSDPASELLVLKHILTRECLLSRLESVCSQLRKRFQLHPAAATSDGTTLLGEGGDGIVNLLSSIRNATVAVIEAISVWRKDMNGHPPSAFVWDGDNYLLKITNDLNFLAGVQPLAETLKMHPARFCRNPLMLPQTLDEQRRDGELYQGGIDAISSGAAKRRHLYQVAQVLLDEESLEGERDALRRESSKSMGALQAGDGTLTGQDLSGQQGLNAGRARYGMRSCALASGMYTRGPQASDRSPVSYSSNSFACRGRAVEDKEMLRRQQRLSTWYEEARSQLVSLSTTPADEEYFLSSRRFWSKEELGDSGSGGGVAFSPPAHRRPPGHLRPGRGGHRSGVNVSSASPGTGGVDFGQRSGTGIFADGRCGGGGGGCDGERLPGHKQETVPPPGQDSHFEKLRADGQPRQGIGGNAHQRRGDGDDDERGMADIWSRPDRFGGGNSAALSCLTVDGIEQILRTVDPSPATVAVCAAIVFLLAPEDQEPVDFLWPQGFEAVALPAEDFLWTLHQASGSTASSAKAGFLAPVLQREHLLPEVIEQQGEHAVASLCAWALEELQDWQEFAEWSRMALEPWYEIQLIPAREVVRDSDGVPGYEVRLVYKALHTLPHAGGSYVMSLFEGSGGDGSLIVRAFDRAKGGTLWLSLSKDKIDSFGSNDTRSPATLAAALTRRLKMKVDAAAGTRRLVLPPAKKVESSSDKKKRAIGADRATGSVDSGTAGGVEPRAEAGAGVEASGGTCVAGETAAMTRSPPRPSTEDPATAELECSGQARSHQRRSYPPPTRGSSVEDLGPLVEIQGDGSECSEGDVGHAQSEPSVVGANGTSASIDDDVVTRLNPSAIAGEAGSSPSFTVENTTLSGELTGARQKEAAAQARETEEATLDRLKPPTAPQAGTTLNHCGSGVGEAEEEEGSVYANDFALDKHQDNGLGLQGEVGGVGAEESGSYADDFAVEEDDNYEEDNDQGDHHEGPGEQMLAAAKLLGEVGDGLTVVRTPGSSIKTPAASNNGADLSGGVGISSCLERNNASESAVAVTGSATEVHPPRKSVTVVADPLDGFDPTQSGRKHGGTGVDSVGGSANVEGRATEDHGYDNELLGEDGKHSDRARVEDAKQSNQPGVPVFAGEVSAVAENEQLQHIQQGKDEPRRAPRETASVLKALDEATVDELGDRPGVEQMEAARRVEAQEGGIGHDSERTSEAEAEHRSVEDLPRRLILKPIVVDMLGNVNVERGYVCEDHACSFEDSSREDLQDEFETSAASEIAVAVVASVTGSAFELVSEKSEGYVAEIGGDAVSCTDITTAPEIIAEASDSSAVAAASNVVTDYPQLTSAQPPRGDFEDMPEGCAGDGKTRLSRGDEPGTPEVLSVPGGTAIPVETDLAAEVRCEEAGSDDYVEEQPPNSSPAAVARDRPSLHEQEHGGEETSGRAAREKIDLDEVAVREDPAVESTWGVSSTAEDVDFEEDFEEDFDDDFDADATKERPDEEEYGVSFDVVEADESLTPNERISEIYEEADGAYSQGDRASESAVDSESSLAVESSSTPLAPVAGERGLSYGDGEQRQGLPVESGQVDLGSPAGEEGDWRGDDVVRPKPAKEATTTAEARQGTAAAARTASSASAAEPPDEFGDDFEDDFEDP